MWFVQSVNRDTASDQHVPELPDRFGAQGSVTNGPPGYESRPPKGARAHSPMPLPKKNLPNPFMPAGTTEDQVSPSHAHSANLPYSSTLSSRSLQRVDYLLSLKDLKMSLMLYTSPRMFHLTMSQKGPTVCQSPSSLTNYQITGNQLPPLRTRYGCLNDPIRDSRRHHRRISPVQSKQVA